MRSQYIPRNEYVGAGNLDTYDTDFKIEAEEDVLVRIIDDEYQLVYEGRSGDSDFTDFVTSVTINSDSTATIVLVDDLETDYQLFLLLADDDPVQPSEFKEKSGTTLTKLEAALDRLSGQIQRLTYLAKRSLRIGDDLLDDEMEEFDSRVPIYSTDDEIQDNVEKVIGIGTDNKSIVFGPTFTDIEQAVAAAEAAAILGNIVRKTTFSYTDLAAAALTNNIEAFELAPKEYIEWVLIKHSVAFGGGLISAYRVSLGLAGDLEYFQNQFNVFQAVGGTVFAKTFHGGDIQSFTAATSIKLAAVSVGANLNQATTGSVDIYVKKGLLP